MLRSVFRGKSRIGTHPVERVGARLKVATHERSAALIDASSPSLRQGASHTPSARQQQRITQPVHSLGSPGTSQLRPPNDSNKTTTTSIPQKLLQQAPNASYDRHRNPALKHTALTLGLDTHDARGRGVRGGGER